MWLKCDVTALKVDDFTKIKTDISDTHNIMKSS